MAADLPSFRYAASALLHAMLAVAAAGHLSAAEQAAGTAAGPVPTPDPTQLKTAWSAVGYAAPFTPIPPVVGDGVVIAAGQQRVTGFAPDGRRLWEVPVLGYHQRPLIAGQRVVLTDTRLCAGLDARSGAVVWTIDLGTRGRNDASPALAGDTVIVPLRDGMVWAIGLDGQVRWRREYDKADFLAAVGVGDAVLLVDWLHGLQAVALADGEPLWRSALPGLGAEPPCVVGGDCLVLCCDADHGQGGVCRLDLRDGHERWRADAAANYLCGPVVVDGMVIAGSRNHVVGCDAATGAERWRFAREWFGYERIDVDQAGRVLLGDARGLPCMIAADDGRTIASFDLRPLARAAGAPLQRGWKQPLATALPAGATVSVMSGAAGAAGPQPYELMGTCSPLQTAPGRAYATTSAGWFVALDCPGLLPLRTTAPPTLHIPRPPKPAANRSEAQDEAAPGGAKDF